VELVVVVIGMVVAVAVAATATVVARVMAGLISAWLGDGVVALLLVFWHRTQKQASVYMFTIAKVGFSC
jgi:anti-sigma factor RsiW